MAQDIVSTPGEIEDGFGGAWRLCHERCGLQVVRPGKVQCECDGMDEATKALMLASDPDEQCDILGCYAIVIATVFPKIGFGQIALNLCAEHSRQARAVTPSYPETRTDGK
jgi:hypothetical protein